MTDRAPIPKPPKKEKKQPKPLKRSYIKRKPVDFSKVKPRTPIKTKFKKSDRAPSIIQSEETPYFVKYGHAGEPLDAHEPICGCNKRTSEDNGLWIWVYRSDHTWLDSKDGAAYNNELKKMVQRKWLEENDNDLEGWINMIGWNYLD